VSASSPRFGVVGPLARFQAVRSPRAKSRDFRKRAGGLELNGGAQGVPDRQAENRAPAPVPLFVIKCHGLTFHLLAALAQLPRGSPWPDDSGITPTL
jgi:hypothetical protein